jgi:hypothetical protein
MASKKKSTDKETPGLAEKGKRLAISEVPEVQEFLDLKQEIDALRADNPDVFMRYNDLVDRYNTKLEEADAKVRSMGVTCGPFENFSVSHAFDAAKMLDELGEPTYLACGGKITQRAVYEVDAATVHAAIASGKIPKDAVDNFMTVKRSYHAPKKIQG